LIAQENETKENITYSNITEFGFITASPKGIAFEATTAHGFSIDKTHHLGLGIGIGTSMGVTTYEGYNSSSARTSWAAYMPVFLNYRFYFKPEKSFSPHVNVAVGGLIPKEGFGIYSSITMGFRAGKFSFSSGISMLAIQREYFEYREIYDQNGWISSVQNISKLKWTYPFGITLKWGFSF